MNKKIIIVFLVFACLSFFSFVSANNNPGFVGIDNSHTGGPDPDGKCGNGVCDEGESFPSYPYYCPKDCVSSEGSNEGSEVAGCLKDGEVGKFGQNRCCAGLKEEMMQTATVGSTPHIVCRQCQGDNCGSNKFGNYSKIKILPETASLKAQERLGELNFDVSLKEVGEKENVKPLYGVSAKKEFKLFGFFKIQGKVFVDVDTETGEVLKIRKPWWSFLTW